MAHRPRTQMAYSNQFKLFIALSVFMEVQDFHSTEFILCFLTYLYDNGLTAQSIAGYVAAIKHKFTVYGFDISVLENRLVSLLQRSFTINAPLKIRSKGLIDINLLKNIILACDYLQYPLLYKAIFLLAFYTFLRISHFAPTIVSAFDTTRHLTRGDVVWGSPVHT